MPCRFATITTPTDWDGTTSRNVARELGIGKSAVNAHRSGTCACKGDTPEVHTDTQDTEGSVTVNNDGGEFNLPKRTAPIESTDDWAHIFREFGLDPAKYAIVDDAVSMSKWQQSKRTETGDRDIVWLWSYKARFTRRVAADDVNLPALYAALQHATPVPSPAPAKRATVVVYADPQVGKTGRRGGTKELLERSAAVRHQLADILTDREPSEIVLADAGDGVEGFESGGNPMFTNDLSLAGQLDVYGTELFEFINTCHAHAPVTVLGVPSNHAAWRNGKQNLGTPGDDLGLFMHRQVEKVTEAARMSVDWVRPDVYDESVAHNVLGTTLGLVHGNQFGPSQAVSWWEKQTFGAGAICRADVMVHGHYHTFSAGVAGRNPINGRQRYCFGTPTLDNGSDWFRQTAGRDSDPGLLVFDITEDGFDLGSLTILQANTPQQRAA